MYNQSTYKNNQVSVIIPAYNEERFLREALDSIVEQVDCVLLGDNASTDGTEAICREFAEKYPHFEYLRHAENLGSIENTHHLVSRVNTEYFFQMGAHDILPDNYVATLKNILIAQPDAVCAYGNCRYIEWDGTVSRILDFAGVKDGMRNDDPYVRAAAFFRGKQPCDLIFGIFRSTVGVPILRKVEKIAGCDHIIPVAAALFGKLVYSPDTYFGRRMAHPNDTEKAYMRRIIGQNMAVNGSKDCSIVGQRLHQLFQEYRKPLVLTPDQEKSFQELLFQLAWKYGTPTDRPFWDFFFRNRKIWKKSCTAIKKAILPGYTAKKIFKSTR